MEIPNPKSQITNKSQNNPKAQNSKPSLEASQNIPNHIAIIMDGNGRWARKRGLPRIEGHRKGAISLKETVKACVELGIKYLTVYAFSTENWKRPKEEVSFLMNILSATIDREIDGLHKNGIKVRFSGRIAMLPEKLQKKIRSAEEKTADNDRLNLNIMLSYGGRAEITDALKSIVKNHIKSDRINEETISQHLYTAGMPDPDLLIRTAGEMRVSNFMLWQIAYAEIWVTEVLWPDFRKKHLIEAIEDYNRRIRKFGGL
jgi:undecaprenyl diphosphate synthase